MFWQRLGKIKVDTDRRKVVRIKHMKETARILRFKSKELKTADDINKVCEALIDDLLSGEITPTEHRKIQREVTTRINDFGGVLKTLEAWQKAAKS